MVTEPIKVTDRLPNDGEYIIGRSVMGFWVEEFDVDESIGIMLQWKPLTESQYNDYLKQYTSIDFKNIWNEL